VVLVSGSWGFRERSIIDIWPWTSMHHPPSPLVPGKQLVPFCSGDGGVGVVNLAHVDGERIGLLHDGLGMRQFVGADAWLP
jgi:hypothetical protein